MSQSRQKKQSLLIRYMIAASQVRRDKKGQHTGGYPRVRTGEREGQTNRE